MNDITIGKIIGLATAVLILCGLVLWGVPHYIAGQVRAQVTTELDALPADPHPVTAREFQEVATKVGSTEATVLRMEAAMIERDRIILKYFQDKAGDAAGDG
jgi:hypothetical protein